MIKSVASGATKIQHDLMNFTSLSIGNQVIPLVLGSTPTHVWCKNHVSSWHTFTSKHFDPHCGPQSCFLNILCTTAYPPFLNEDRTQRVSHTQSRVSNPILPLFLHPFSMAFPSQFITVSLATPGSRGSGNFTWTCGCVCPKCRPGWITLSRVKQNRHLGFFFFSSSKCDFGVGLRWNETAHAFMLQQPMECTTATGSCRSREQSFALLGRASLWKPTTKLCHEHVLQFWKLSHKTVLQNCTIKLLCEFILSSMHHFKKSEAHEKRGATPSGQVLKKLLQNCRIKLCHKFMLQFWKLSHKTVLWNCATKL